MVYGSDWRDAPGLVELAAAGPDDDAIAVDQVAPADVDCLVVVGREDAEALALGCSLGRYHFPLLVDGVVGLADVEVGALGGVGVVGYLEGASALGVDDGEVALVVGQEGPQLVVAPVELPQN